MNDYLISSHPDEWQVWLFGANPMHPLDHPQAVLIWLGEALENGLWNHMCWRKGEKVYSAEPGGFLCLDARPYMVYDGRIVAMTFAAPLTPDEDMSLTSFLTEPPPNGIAGVPYDWLLTGQRGAAALLRLAAWLSGHPVLRWLGNALPVDVAGAHRVNCYESIFRGLMALGWDANPATDGPRELWGLVNLRRLTVRGQVLNTTATGEGGNERC